MSQIAYLGLGTMGSGMVSNLLKAGHSVTVWNRSPGRADELVAAGATEAASIAEAVAGKEFVMSCLADDAAVRDVVLGAAGVVENVDPRSIVIDMSTISPTLSDEEASAFEARGVPFLDAPVFGSKGEAASGGLWVVVGGSADVLDRARPVLEPVSETIHHMGPQGSGARMKLVGNLIVASQLYALGEALTLALKSGLKIEDVLDVLHVTDFKSPIFDGVGAAVAQADYSPAFALKLMLKDAKLMREWAGRVGAHLTGPEAAIDVLEAGVEQGLAEQNASALIKVIAERSGVELPR